MNIVNYMNHFWFQNQYDPCSSSETTLFHYLLFEAERQQWVMPFKLPTQMVISYTGLSKQSVIDAREGLKERGLITYSKGGGKGRPALYSLVLNDTDEVYTQQYRRITSSQNATDSKTQKLTEDVARRVPLEPIQELPQDLTHESTQNGNQDLTQNLTQEQVPNSLMRLHCVRLQNHHRNYHSGHLLIVINRCHRSCLYRSFVRYYLMTSHGMMR